MARPKKKQKNQSQKMLTDGKPDGAQQFSADEKKVDDALKAMGKNGERIIAETKLLNDGFRNINPLQIGKRLDTVRDLYGVKITEVEGEKAKTGKTGKTGKKTKEMQAWSDYLKVKIFPFGFSRSTIDRYIGAYRVATKQFPEPFVNEMASHMFGQSGGVDRPTPFGKFTAVAFAAMRKSKAEMGDPTKVVLFTQRLLANYKLREDGKGKEDKPYIKMAYEAVMNYLRLELKQRKEKLLPLEAKDIFIADLAPYILAGFGMSVGFVEEVEAKKLPSDWLPFDKQPVPPQQNAAPMGEAKAAPPVAEVVSVKTNPQKSEHGEPQADAHGKRIKPVTPAAAG